MLAAGQPETLQSGGERGRRLGLTPGEQCLVDGGLAVAIQVGVLRGTAGPSSFGEIEDQGGASAVPVVEDRAGGDQPQSLDGSGDLAAACRIQKGL